MLWKQRIFDSYDDTARILQDGEVSPLHSESYHVRKLHALHAEIE